MNEQLKTFLSDFSNVAYRMYPHRAQKTEITNINTNRTIEEWLALNEETPSNLYFAPNFQFGANNPIGSMADFQDSAVQSWAYPCAFVFDYNLQQFEDINTKAELLEHIKTILKKKLVWSYKYIVETGNWYHVYYIIEKDWRETLSYSFDLDYSKLYQSIARNISANSDWRLLKKGAVFRLPESYIWNLDEKIQCKIIESTDKYITVDQVVSVISDIDIMDKVQEAERKYSTLFNVWEFRKFLETSPIDLMDLFWVDGQELIVENNRIVLPIGFWYEKFFWGWSMAVIYSLCDGDSGRMIQALQGKLKMTMKWRLDFSWEDNQIIAGNGYSISFTGSIVQLTQSVPNAKWDFVDRTSIIFRNYMRIVGKWYVNSSWMWETKIPELVIVAMVDWEEKIIHQQPSKNAHNKAYTSIFFYWQDNDLGLFFNGIINDNSIPHIDIYERSGYYDWETIVLGNQCIFWWEVDSRILLWENEFEICDDVEQITVKEYFEKFRKCYKDEFSIPLFLCALALAGMNLWTRLEVNPAVLVSGKTGCGKSTVAALLKKMLWYAPTVREMALPSLTAQPLKQMASDNAILFLEELTARVSPTTEELLRNVVNRDKAARWTIDWNTWWNFRSPLRVNGERTFKDESLNNRFCGFIMTSSYWQEWASTLINDLQKYTAYEDIYNIYNKNRETINDMLITYKYKLLDAWMPARASDVWSYMFVINDVFNFWIAEEELIWYVKTHLEKTGLQEKPHDVGVGVMVNTIASACIMRKVSMSVKEKRIDNEPYLIVTLLYTDPDFYQMSRGIINSCVSELRNKIWDWYIDVSDMFMSFKILDKREKIDKFTDQGSQEVANIVWEIVEMLPWSIASNNKWFMYIDWI